MQISSTKYKPAIVIPAFKRVKSLSRLLTSINEAIYPDSSIQIVISLDYGNSEEVKELAANFVFKHGKKEVIEHSKKLGIKDHIISCADLAIKYGSVIILEEDLVVSSGYYMFAQKGLNSYSEEDRVAGISLYSQRFNESAQLPFEPLKTEYSTYFMKLVCSWGQAWSDKQWSDFKDWYSGKDLSSINALNGLPENVKKWNNSSWKKYFNAYLLESDKVFVYPYDGYSTHCTDEIGENIQGEGYLFQTPLKESIHEMNETKFPDLNDFPIVYDTYMECSTGYIQKLLDMGGKSLQVDLYGLKPVEILKKSEFIITSRQYKAPIKSFPLWFKPIEKNIKFEVSDSDGGFFNLYRSKDIHNKKLSGIRYYRLAKYLSYQNFSTKLFFAQYLREIVLRVLRWS